MSDERERMIRLQSAELHGAMPAETPGIEITKKDVIDEKWNGEKRKIYTELKCDRLCLIVFYAPKTQEPFGASFDDDTILRTARDFQAADALLQEARRVMHTIDQADKGDA